MMQRPSTSYGANTNPYDPYVPVLHPGTYPSPPPATPPYPHQYTQPPPAYPEQYGPTPMNRPNPYLGVAPSPVSPGAFRDPPSPQPRRTSPTKTIVLLLLAALVILVGIGLALFIPYQQAQMRRVNATATAQEQATDVARTATTIAHEATATVEANASATAAVVAANPNPYPPNNGTLILYDPLTNNQENRWPDSVDQSGTGCTFKDGAYHVSAAKGYDQSCGINSYTDFTFEARMTILTGDCGALSFRRSDAASYLFTVCQNGAYFLDTSTTSGQTALLKGSSSAIKAGLNQTNVLAVVAKGTTIDLYVNGQHLDGITDNSSSASSLGFGALAPNDSTEVAFSDMKLWTL